MDFKKTALGLIIFGVLLAGLAGGVFLAQRETQLKSKAGDDSEPCTVDNGCLAAPPDTAPAPPPPGTSPVPPPTAPQPAPPPPQGATSNCPLADPTASNEALIASCTLGQLATLSNERLLKFSNDFLLQFPNDVLLKFPNERLITFPGDRLKTFPSERIATFPCYIQEELGFQCGQTIAPPSGGPSIGGTCRYQLLNTNGEDITGGPLYQNTRYRIKVTITNTKDAPWTAGIFKLKTGAFWGAEPFYALTENKLKNSSPVVFDVPVTAPRVLSADNFQDHPMKFVMVDGNLTEIGEACSPALRVLKPEGAVPPPGTPPPPPGTPPGTPPLGTACYFISSVPFTLGITPTCNLPEARPYLPNTKIAYDLGAAPGVKTVFVRFISSRGDVADFQKSIALSPNPTITGAECQHQVSGTGTAIVIAGTNFGSFSANNTVKIKGKSGRIVSASWADNLILANLEDEKLTGENDIEVKRSDGTIVTGRCTVGVTSLSFTAKSQCKLNDFSAENVDVKIFANVVGADPRLPLVTQKVKLNREGMPETFTPQIEKGRQYVMLIDAPRTLARKVTFNAVTGTTNVESAELRAGNIYPPNNPDNIINNLDTSEMKRQWKLLSSSSNSSCPTADLNGDCFVNSHDYSCQLKNFNQTDEVFTAPVAAPAPAPAPQPAPPPAGGTPPAPPAAAVATSLTMSADKTTLPVPSPDNQIVVFTGTLRDSSNNPVSGKVITLILNGTVVKTTVPSYSGDTSFNSDASGNYRIALATSSPIPPATFTFTTRFEGDSTHQASQSQPVTVTPTSQ